MAPTYLLTYKISSVPSTLCKSTKFCFISFFLSFLFFSLLVDYLFPFSFFFSLFFISPSSSTLYEPHRFIFLFISLLHFLCRRLIEYFGFIFIHVTYCTYYERHCIHNVLYLLLNSLSYPTYFFKVLK